MDGSGVEQVTGGLQAAGVPLWIIGGIAVVFAVIFGLQRLGLMGNKGDKGEVGERGKDGNTYGVAVAIEALGEKISTMGANLESKIDGLERKFDRHDQDDKDRDNRRSAQIETLFEKVSVHGEDLATLKAHRDQWDTTKPDRRARG